MELVLLGPVWLLKPRFTNRCAISGRSHHRSLLQSVEMTTIIFTGADSSSDNHNLAKKAGSNLNASAINRVCKLGVSSFHQYHWQESVSVGIWNYLHQKIWSWRPLTNPQAANPDDLHPVWCCYHAVLVLLPYIQWYNANDAILVSPQPTTGNPFQIPPTYLNVVKNNSISLSHIYQLHQETLT